MRNLKCSGKGIWSGTAGDEARKEEEFMEDYESKDEELESHHCRHRAELLAAKSITIMYRKL